MILDDIFEFLSGLRLVSNHANFSTDYLGHSARYYDYLRCSGKQPSIRSLVKVSGHLQRLGCGSKLPAKFSDRARLLATQALEAVLDRCC